MRKRPDLVSFKRPDNDRPARWAIYSIKHGRWQEGAFGSKREADCAAREIERLAVAGGAPRPDIVERHGSGSFHDHRLAGD